MRSAGRPDQLWSAVRAALSGALDGPVAQVSGRSPRCHHRAPWPTRWSRCSHADLPRPLPTARPVPARPLTLQKARLAKRHFGTRRPPLKAEWRDPVTISEQHLPGGDLCDESQHFRHHGPRPPLPDARRGLCLLTLLSHSYAQERRDPTPRPEVAVLPPHEHPTNADRARPPRSASVGPTKTYLPWAECTRSLGSQAVVVASPPARNCTAAPCLRRRSAAPTRAGVAATPRRAAAHTASTLPSNRHGDGLLGGYSTSINRTDNLRRVAAPPAQEADRSRCQTEHPRRATRRAAASGPGCRSDALEESHRYSLPSFTERIKTRLRNHCQEDHHSCPLKAVTPATQPKPLATDG